MPAEASATTAPSRTSANANTSTHDTAKNNVVATISRLLTSIVTSLRSTSSATRRNMSAAPHEIAIARAQSRSCGFVGHDASAAHERDARHQAVGDVEVVRRDEHDAPLRGESAQAIDSHADRFVVEAGEGLVEQHEPRLVKKRALERQPL